MNRYLEVWRCSNPSPLHILSSPCLTSRLAKCVRKREREREERREREREKIFMIKKIKHFTREKIPKFPSLSPWRTRTRSMGGLSLK